MIEVPLTWWEVLLAAQAGLYRNVGALRDRRRLEEGRTDLGFERHVIGAIGEYALAKYLGVTFKPVIGALDTAVGDVAGYQVRTTALPGARLIVKPEDDDSSTFVLVTVPLHREGPVARIHGCRAAAECKRDEWWTQAGHRGAWFVPQTALLELPR